MSTSSRRSNALIVFASLLAVVASNVAFAQPLGTKTFQPSTKLVRAGAWRDVKYRLLVPGGDAGKSAIVDINAKFNSYRVPGARYGFSLVVLHDPGTNKTLVMPGIGGRRGFYVSTDGGILGVHLNQSGDLYLARNFVEFAAPALDLEEAEERFESEFDETKASRHLSRTVSMGLRTATGPGIFWLPGAPSAEVDLRADLDGSLLHLVLANPKTEKTASLWIDLKASRIVRAIDTSGQERRNVASAKVWITTTARLLRSGVNGSQASSQPMDVSVQSASFYVLGTGEEFSVAAVTDPLTKKLTFIHYDQFFASLSSGMVSLSTQFGGVTFRRQFFQTSAGGDIAAALQTFAETFEPGAFRRVTADAIRVSVASVIDNGTSRPQTQLSVSGSQLNDRLEQHSDLSDGILHLVWANTNPNQTAAVWVDIRPGSLFLQRIVRAELGGQVRPLPAARIGSKERLVTRGKPARFEELPEVDVTYARLPFASDPLLAVVHDVQSKRVSIVAGRRDYFLTTLGVRQDPALTFYIPRVDGLLGVIITANRVAFSPAYFVAPDSTDGPDAALAVFERSFDRDTLDRQIAAHEVAVDVMSAIGEAGFPDDGTRRTLPPRVDVIDVQGNTLRLVLTDPIARRTVTLWFDVNSCRLIRSSIAGQER